jgi:cytochrome c556
MVHERRPTVAAALTVLTLLGLALGTALSSSRAEQERKRTRSEFMRQKLEFSKNVLEGLSLEQYPTIEKNAKALKLLSQAAEWEVPTIPNATDYVALTTEFQRYADELIKNARHQNIDGATLAYLKLTMNCVQCHKYVRFASQ